MNLSKAMLLKLLSVLLFTCMAACIRYIGERAAIGQLVFFRSFFSLVPLLLIYAFHGGLRGAFRTKRPFGHLGRGFISVAGMFFSFAALARLPLVDATAIGFAAPLMTVALAAVILREKVRIYRWSAVAVGFVGVIIMLWPYLNLGHLLSGSAAMTIGALCALAGAMTSAAAVIQTRRLTDSESTSAIVLYLSIYSTVAAALTLPFSWLPLAPFDVFILMCAGFLGGASHIALTVSYRYAPASLVAAFDYTAMLWAFLIGFFFFGELPTGYLYVGGFIVAISGLFVLWREGQLGLRKGRGAIIGPPAGK